MTAPSTRVLIAILPLIMACGGRTEGLETTEPEGTTTSGTGTGIGTNTGTGTGTGTGSGIGTGKGPDDAGAPMFPVGVYECQSSVLSQSANVTGNGGATGTLTLTQQGATLTAAYAGDPFTSGTIDFTVTTRTSANLASEGQTLQAECGSGLGLTTVTVASGSLVSDANTIILSIVGSGRACATTVTISLVCEEG